MRETHLPLARRNPERFTHPTNRLPRTRPMWRGVDSPNEANPAQLPPRTKPIRRESYRFRPKSTGGRLTIFPSPRRFGFVSKNDLPCGTRGAVPRIDDGRSVDFRGPNRISFPTSDPIIKPAEVAERLDAIAAEDRRRRGRFPDRPGRPAFRSNRVQVKNTLSDRHETRRTARPRLRGIVSV